MAPAEGDECDDLPRSKRLRREDFMFVAEVCVCVIEDCEFEGYAIEPDEGPALCSDLARAQPRQRSGSVARSAKAKLRLDFGSRPRLCGNVLRERTGRGPRSPGCAIQSNQTASTRITNPSPGPLAKPGGGVACGPYGDAIADNLNTRLRATHYWPTPLAVFAQTLADCHKARTSVH